MLSKEDIIELKSSLGFNLGQLEKDYLQHLFLLFLSRHLKDELVFKGGTALQKAYGLNRFSEDLDFTLNREMNIDELIEKIKKDIENFGFKAEYKLLSSKISKCYRLRINGPLYDGTERSIASLRIEISLRKDLLLEPDTKEIIPAYIDLQPYIVLIMNTEEILAEKIRSIFQREKARDMYDMWFLLKKGIKINYSFVEKKTEFYNIKFNKNSFLKRISRMKKIWKEELSGYVSFIPDFNEVFKYISGQLNLSIT